MGGRFRGLLVDDQRVPAGLGDEHVGGDDVDLNDLFELHADALVDIVGRLSTQS